MPGATLVAAAAAAAAAFAVPTASMVVPQGELIDIELLSLGALGAEPPWQDHPSASVAVVGPSVTVQLQAFVSVNFTRSLRPAAPGGGEPSELLTASSGPQLRFRFRPSYVGTYTWSAAVTWRGQPSSRRGSFIVTAAAAPPASMIGVAQNGRYFCEGQDGAPYYPVGGNIECWDCVLGEKQYKPWGNYGGSRAPANGTFEFERWFGRLAKAGGNFARVWINTPYGIWTELASNITVPGERGPVTLSGGGLGRYDMASAWRLDHIITTASKLGIRVLLSVEMARTQDDSRNWGWSPYNRQNGGMLSNGAGFFTDAAAMEAFETRLRYLVARFAHHTSIFAWELFNEVNCDSDIPDPHGLADWHWNMSRVLEDADSYGHMVTTSFCADPLVKPAAAADNTAVYSLAGMSFSQTHQYQNLAPGYFDQYADSGKTARVMRASTM